MTNTTATYWDVDGTSLQTYAMNISTKGDGRNRAPALRGDDIVIPYRKGKRWVPKIIDSRELTLQMWVRGVNDNGSHGTNAEDLYEKNWRNLHGLLFTPGRQFALTKRFKIGGVVKSATALAEFADGLEPSMYGRSAGQLEVVLSLADPWFYDTTPTILNLTNGDNVVDIPGDQETTDITIEINGARDNVLLVNKGYSPTISLRHTAALVSGDKTTIDVDAFSAMTDPTGVTPPYRSNTLIQHSGDPMWFKLKPGKQTLALSSDSGTGGVTASVRGAWW